MNQTFEQHKELEIGISSSMDVKSILFFSYFVTNDGNFVTLSTFELFKKDCRTPSLEIVNKFDKSSSKWRKKLEFYDKFMDYYGCELVMLLPIYSKEFPYHYGYAVVNNYQTDFRTYGLTPELFRIAGSTFNFRAAYQPALIDNPNYMIGYESHQIYKYPINKTVKTTNVLFDVLDLENYNMLKIKVSQIFMSWNSEFVSTPVEDYSPFEKFLMLFDELTWILLTFEILCMFLAVLAAHQLVKRLFTSLNTSWKFFGYFRFVLTFFASFFLIFGIFFQGKSFELLSAEPRRPTPKTIQDLIDQNYTMLDWGKSELQTLVEEEADEWPRLERRDGEEIIEIYKTQSQNSSAKICLFFDSILVPFTFWNREIFSEWNRINDRTINFNFQGIATYGLAFCSEMIQKTAVGMFEAGIMKYLIDTRVFVVKNQQRKLSRADFLNFSDFSVYFALYFGLCGFSLISLTVEIFLNSNAFRNILKFIYDPKTKAPKFRFAKIHHVENCKIVEKQKVKKNLDLKFRLKGQNIADVETVVRCGSAIKFEEDIGLLVEDIELKNDLQLEKFGI
ncbi:unnamed protein product [Chironomus riparius]|uniref:Ionotropic receptor n=1 Tax=Chironomus riparius TaxID=315576 RepID=A0A9N9WV30_9DIPT|nr:unnamed protein product [Chironomus riparius]